MKPCYQQFVARFQPCSTASPVLDAWNDPKCIYFIPHASYFALLPQNVIAIFTSGMFRILKNLFERKSASTWQALVDHGAFTAAGIHVSPATALKCVPVYAGVKVRTETIGSLPLHLYQRNDGAKKRATEHPLYALLHDRPNEWTSSADFIMELEKDTLTHGAGYALANRSGDRIVELLRLEPGSVSCEHDDNTEPRYRVTLKGNVQRIYSWRDVLHVPATCGLAAIKQAANAIGLYIALEKHGAQIFAAGGRPSGILKSTRRLTPETLERLKASWDANHTGERAGRTAVLEEGIDFTALSFKSVDLQFHELRAFQVVEIARALGVPPVLIGDLGRATWSNSEQMAQAFLTFTILPRLKLWQGAISRLLSAEEQKTFFPEFLIDELVKASIAERFEAYAKAITNGFLNPNEVRAMENRPPYEGGDEFRLPLNTAAPGTEPTPTPKPKPKLGVAA